MDAQELDDEAFGRLDAVKDVKLDMQSVDYATDQELANFKIMSESVYDVECYSNLFYIAFKHLQSGKVYDFELSPGATFNPQKLLWVMKRFKLISFNGRKYDIHMLCAALLGYNNEELKNLSDRIIREEMNTFAVEREFKLRERVQKRYGLDVEKIDHVDIIEVCPLSASLKIYGGRVHARRMQDLPYPVDAILTYEEAQYVKNYCANDLENTELLFTNLSKQLELRETLGFEYRQDLRSKSDAQIAEAVIGSEIKAITGRYPKRPEFSEGGSVRYIMPHFIRFNDPKLQRLANEIALAKFPLSASGNPKWPEGLGEKLSDDNGNLKKDKDGRHVWGIHTRIGDTVYRMGMGGLHSSEKVAAHIADEDTVIADHDVESYYPRIIINQGLYPKQLGKTFLTVFERIVDKRVKAKRSGDKTTSDSLKIVINGTFGKLGSRYSIIFSPDLLAQVTLSGQLSLLMLVERLEAAGISVISANTDGIVLKLSKSMLPTRDAIIAQWEKDCGYITEETRYVALYSRDVNNYIALKQGYDKESGWLPSVGGVKFKGEYSNPWADGNSIFRFHKNPEATICVEAVSAFLTDRTPVAETIRACQDMRKFVVVQAVRGGCHKDGAYLGKAVRWYYSRSTVSPISRMNGNKVPVSDGAMPIMDMDGSMKPDINYAWYIDRCQSMLQSLGALTKKGPATLF